MKIISAAILIMFLVGCDTYYGLARRINTDHVVKHECIGDALSSIEGIHNIQHKQTEGGIPLTITGLQEPDQVHYYFYKVGSLNGYIYISTNYERKTEIAQTYGALNIIPPQEDINKIRPLMVKVEAALMEKCKIENIETLVKETCNGVICA